MTAHACQSRVEIEGSVGEGEVGEGLGAGVGGEVGEGLGVEVEV